MILTSDSRLARQHDVTPACIGEGGAGQSKFDTPLRIAVSIASMIGASLDDSPSFDVRGGESNNDDANPTCNLLRWS